VRMFRDPITWLSVLGRLRFAKIDPMSVVEQTHAPSEKSAGAPSA